MAAQPTKICRRRWKPQLKIHDSLGCAGGCARAFLNGALVRYLDFTDASLAKGETRHPSGNLAAEVERVDIETFDVAFNIIGDGEESDKTARGLMRSLSS